MSKDLSRLHVELPTIGPHGIYVALKYIYDDGFYDYCNKNNVAPTAQALEDYHASGWKVVPPSNQNTKDPDNEIN